MKTKTKVEILNETVEYYKTNLRGINPNSLSCVYFVAETGAKCGVGRCCIDPKATWYGPPSDGLFLDGPPPYYDHTTPRVPLDELLFPEYRGHCGAFWDQLQRFHDIPDNWKDNDKGGSDLTSAGYEELERLLNLWADQ